MADHGLTAIGAQIQDFFAIFGQGMALSDFLTVIISEDMCLI